MSSCNVLTICCLLFLAFACNKDKLPPPQPSDCAPIPVYEGQIKEIIDFNCSFAGCHDGSSDAPGDFTTYGGMLSRLNNGDIRERSIVIQDMPELPFSMSQEHFDSLKCWIDNGFPKN